MDSLEANLGRVIDRLHVVPLPVRHLPAVSLVVLGRGAAGSRSMLPPIAKSERLLQLTINRFNLYRLDSGTQTNLNRYQQRMTYSLARNHVSSQHRNSVSRLSEPKTLNSTVNYVIYV